MVLPIHDDNPTRRTAWITYVLIAIGYVLQLAGLGLRGRAVGGCPLGNQLEIFQFTACAYTQQ